jgi:NAD(P)H-hydrate repair Nnr-like enzyme with NAD(P)H-hydrate epimerase domain
LLTEVWRAIGSSQPGGALVLVGQSEPGCDALVCAEQPLDEIRAVTFLAAMQQYDVIRESVCAIEKL